MANAIVTQGTTFEVDNADGDPGPLTFTTIAGVISFTGFDGSANEIDITDLSSVAKEFRMGLQDFGNFNMEVNFDEADAGQRILRTMKAAGLSRSFQITFSDGSIATFSAFVLSFSTAGGVDAKVDGSIQLRITGNVVFTPAP